MMDFFKAVKERVTRFLLLPVVGCATWGYILFGNYVDWKRWWHDATTNGPFFVAAMALTIAMVASPVVVSLLLQKRRKSNT